MYAELLIPKEFEDLYLEIAGDDQVTNIKSELYFNSMSQSGTAIARVPWFSEEVPARNTNWRGNQEYDFGVWEDDHWWERKFRFEYFE